MSEGVAWALERMERIDQIYLRRHTQEAYQERLQEQQTVREMLSPEERAELEWLEATAERGV